MFRKNFLSSFLIICFFLFLVGNFAYGAGFCQPCDTGCDDGLVCIDGKCQYSPTGNTLRNPLKYCSFEDLIVTITNSIFYIALAIAPLMVVVAGFYFLTAVGEPRKLETARKIITYTAIGVFVILFARGLVYLVTDVLNF
jgi:hypothetical protein